MARLEMPFLARWLLTSRHPTIQVVWVPLFVALALLLALVLPIHVFPVLLSPKWLVHARGALVE